MKNLDRLNFLPLLNFEDFPREIPTVILDPLRRLNLTQDVVEPPVPKKRKGFAAMTPERRAEIASLGGKKAHASGNARQWNSETARVASAKSAEVRGFKVKK